MNKIKIDLTNQTVVTVAPDSQRSEQTGAASVQAALRLTNGRKWVFIPSGDTSVQTFVGPVEVRHV